MIVSWAVVAKPWLSFPTFQLTQAPGCHGSSLGSSHSGWFASLLSGSWLRLVALGVLCSHSPSKSTMSCAGLGVLACHEVLFFPLPCCTVLFLRRLRLGASWGRGESNSWRALMPLQPATTSCIPYLLGLYPPRAKLVIQRHLSSLTDNEQADIFERVQVTLSTDLL